MVATRPIGVFHRLVPLRLHDAEGSIRHLQRAPDEGDEMFRAPVRRPFAGMAERISAYARLLLREVAIAGDAEAHPFGCGPLRHDLVDRTESLGAYRHRVTMHKATESGLLITSENLDCGPIIYIRFQFHSRRLCRFCTILSRLASTFGGT